MPLSLLCLSETYAVCRLPGEAVVPEWAMQGRLWSILRSPEELSVLCVESAVPPGVRQEPGWRGLRIAGTLPFDAVGVLAGLATPLAQAGVSVFVVSSFDTDYLFVRTRDWQRTLRVLQEAGHDLV